MNTELDILILKMRKLHLDTVFIERDYVYDQKKINLDGYYVNTDDFFEKVKFLLLANVTIKEKEITNE